MERGLSRLGPLSMAVGVILTLANWWLSFSAWSLLPSDTLIGLFLVLLALLLAGALLRLSTVLDRAVWLMVWAVAAPWLLAGTPPLLTFLPAPPLWVVASWALLGAAAYFGWWAQTSQAQGLHRAHWSSEKDLSAIRLQELPDDGLLLAKTDSSWMGVRPTEKRKELGNLLVVGRTRSGKGLLATTQLLTWKHSAVVNDLKGELFNNTAGYRSSQGPVFAIDPGGVGHRFDPLASRLGEDRLYSAATSLLMEPNEGEGKIFTQRAISMLASVFAAARATGMRPLPFVRLMIFKGVRGAAADIQAINPRLATRFLDGSYESTDLDSRFLLSAWGTLTARLWPLLTENLVKTFNGHDFNASDLLLSPRPVTVYLRWPEEDLLALAPLVRLIWESLIGELITSYDARSGSGCHPVLLLVDEAGRAPIPTLADHATTVVGRGLNLWVAIQSLSQLEAIYGRARAQVIRDNMETQVYYRPANFDTAQYLERRLGSVSAFAQSTTQGPDGRERSQSQSEQAVPLKSAQQIMEMVDETVIAFHRHLPPIEALRIDWRGNELLERRMQMAPPILSRLPAVAEDVDPAIPQPTYVD